jgi:hypothetical protein
MEATSAGAIPRRGSLRVDAYLGFTRSGEPVRIWSHLGYSSGNLKVFLEIGHRHYELDHVDPNLVEALRASLAPRAA